MSLDIDIDVKVKKVVDKMLPNVVESIGEYIDDILDDKVFGNEEFKDIIWSEKIKIVNYMLYHIKELI